MHANMKPDEVTFVVLKNRKKFNVIPGSFQADEASVVFDYRADGGELRRMSVDRMFIAAVESRVSR